ncbi:MAG: CBS domain-containing protein, partial [Flavobacteriaceae bacterium]|nr:CBS domain-containing protein [Flavobacteriaceae bacterium]
GMTGNLKSFLGEQSDFLLNTAVEKEACPNNLAPTTSTTAQLVMGDALAICLLDLRGFSEQDFAKFHPGGTLGKKLYLRVSDIAGENMKPVVEADADVREVIIEISEKMLGATAVLDQNKLIGIITDGDIRRMLEAYSDINGLKAKDIMTVSPKTIEMDVLAVKALKVMRAKGISQLLAVENGTYKGVVHLHNLINQGIL